MSDENLSKDSILSAWEFSPYRVWVIAQNTFTQLVRMKTFYFLLIFVAIILVIVAAGLLWDPIKHLLHIKRWSFGAMSVFATIYAIAATSLLLPHDIEDRTLYTILSKPVPRFEYMLGRYLGVVGVIGVSLLAMYLVMCVLVHFKMGAVEDQYINRLVVQAQGEAISEADIQAAKLDARQDGVTMSLFWAQWALALKACVIAAVTLFISTFASSSLFSIITSAMIVFIGHFHQLALNFWIHEAGAGAFGVLVSKLLLIIFPNLGMFDVVDEVITGSTLAFGQAVKITLVGLFYISLYVLLAQLIFVDKEL